MKKFFPLFGPALVTVSSLAGSLWIRQVGGWSGARRCDHVVVVCAPFGFVGGVEEAEDSERRVSWDVESSSARR